MTGTGLATLLAILPHALLCCLVVLALAARTGADGRLRAVVAIVAFAGSLLPIEGTSFASWVRGVTGDLSVPLILLLLSGTASLLVGRRLLSAGERNWFAVTFSAGALILYPCALGLTPLDPYALGYYPLLLAPAVVTLGGLAIARRAHLLSASLSAALLAYSFNVYASTNLWDYLIDPLLAGYTLTIGVRAALAPLLTRASLTERT